MGQEGSKNAIIVGATSGIGRAVAVALAAQGWRVGITGRREELLREVKATAPATFETVVFDVTDDATERHLAALAEALGGFSLLIYSSGAGDINRELDYAIEEHTNRVNVDGFTRAMDWAYRYFLKNNGGHLMAITSVMGLRGSGNAPAYAASKAYQVNYLQGLQQRAAHDPVLIHVTDIRPGSVNTAMMKGEGHFWISTPEEAAKYILRAIKKKKYIQYVSPRWRLVGNLLKNIPGFLHRKI